jgi:hypothetical protein
MTIETPPPRLTRHTLRKMAAFHASRFPDPYARVNVVASEVIQHFLGRDWFQANVATEGAGFFARGAKPTAFNGAERIGSRVNELGELFFNLQHVGGFDAAIRGMQGRRIEPGFYDLEAAKLFFMNELTFSFSGSVGAGGTGHDLEVIGRGGQQLCVDTKARIATTGTSLFNLRNTLDQAAARLGHEMPGVLVVRLPVDWIGEDYQETPFAQVAAEFLQANDRIVSVIAHANPVEVYESHVASSPVVRAFPSGTHRFDKSLNWTLFEHAQTADKWTAFAFLLGFLQLPQFAGMQRPAGG